jgi:HlyD family secretion protein
MKPAVFRRASLERLSSPEQLEELMRVTTPVGWIVQVSLLVLLAVILVWGFLGSIPITVQGQGIIIKSGGIRNIQHIAGGRVTDIKVKSGDLVEKGEVIARVSQYELINQITEERIKLKELLQFESRAAFYTEKDLAVQRTYLSQQETNIRNTIESDREQLAYLEKILATYEEVYQSGGISQKQLLETRTQYNELKVQVAENENRLRENQLQESQLSLGKEKEKTGIESQIDEVTRRIGHLEQNLEYYTNIVSPDTGRIIEIMVNEGSLISAGTTVASIEPTGRTVKNLEAIIYIPSEGKDVKPGMDVQVSPVNIKKEEYGFIHGRVTSISPYPASYEGMLRILGNKNLVESLLGRGPVLEVKVDLVPTTKTKSRLKWSSKDGPPITIQSGTICSGNIIERKQPPISFVVPWLREMMGL